MSTSEKNSAPPTLTLLAATSSQARICTQGGQVMSWTHRGRDRLFTSPRAVFRKGHAIRGGIPVIFPQFGGGEPGLRHGFARLLDWQHLSTAAAPDRATLVLDTSADSLRWWPHYFRAEIEVQLSENALSTAFTVTNCDAEDIEFTAALHTYLRVLDIEQAGLLGLQGQPYIDSANARRPELQSETTLRFAGEVDRIYADSGGRGLTLRDASGVLQVRSEGFADTVVWNPGATLGANLDDLGPGNHANFVCVEAANAETPVRLAPRATWRGSQILTCVDS